jgi:hypothetical protein
LTLAEVLGNVKSGVLSPMGTATRMAKGIGGRPEPMTVAVPAALQAVTLKAMARDRDKRYASVELFAEDIESYQNGFATSAESAGLLRRTRLWVARNRAIAASAAVLLVFLGKVVVDGQRASLAIRRLSASAPVFAARALGFYDLGGNASEWMWDGLDEKTGDRFLRGGGWNYGGGRSRHVRPLPYPPSTGYNDFGFRVARGRLQSGEAGGR